MEALAMRISRMMTVLSVVVLVAGSVMAGPGVASAGDATTRSCDLTAVTVNCPRVDLHGRDLRAFDLTGAVLHHANLRDVVFHGGSMTRALLDHADLRGAQMRRVDLRGSSLAHADLRGADLRHANGGMDRNLSRTAYCSYWGPNPTPPNVNCPLNLTGANMSGMNLSGANLAGANMTNANLNGANTWGANFSGATWSNTTCPDGSNSDVNGIMELPCLPAQWGPDGLIYCYAVPAGTYGMQCTIWATGGVGYAN